MSPKFRGDSDDWLDNPDSSPHKKGQKRSQKGVKKADLSDRKSVTWEEANAIVAEVFPNLCRISFLGAESKPDLTCSYRRAGVLNQAEGARQRSPVAVGDRVLVTQTSPQAGVVEGVSPRRNSLSRLVPGREDGNLFHVIAANVDLLVIVASAVEPLFVTGLVDRFLVAAEAEGIPTLICITKIDLASQSDRPWAAYRDLGYAVVETSVKIKSGLDNLETTIRGKNVVFCGHSGVGKTSLLREFLGEDIGKVGEVNAATGKGRHTTTSAVRYRLSAETGGPETGLTGLIDTPGVREFSLKGISAENLADFFPEFAQLDCTSRDCHHVSESDCQARSLFRHPSYLRIYQSLL